jgi:hypothetical protein
MKNQDIEEIAKIPKGFLLTQEKLKKIMDVRLGQFDCLTEEEVTDIFKEKEIRPENSGETWEYSPKDLKLFTFTNSGLGLSAIDEIGQTGIIPPAMVHGKNGYTRIDPPVEEVWGESAIQNDRYKAAQKYANEVARQALEFLDEMKEDKP